MFTHLLHTIQQGHGTAAAIGFALIVLVSFLPAIPIPVIAAGLGAVLPLWFAVLVAWSATVVGAVLKFVVERTLLRHYVHQILSRYKHWETVLDLVNRHGILAILGTRLIPFFPSAIVNFAAAMTRIPFLSYVGATSIGLFPSVFMFTLAGNQFGHHRWATTVLIVLYAGVICILLWRIRKSFRLRRVTETEK